MYLLLYCPQSCYDNIFKSLHSIPTHSHRILLGDFDITDVDWCTLSSTSSSTSISTSPASAFARQHTHLNLFPLVEVPTHLQHNILHVVFSSQPHLLSNSSVSPSPSDYMPVFINLSSSTNISVSPVPRFRWNFSRADVDGLFCLFPALILTQ